MSDPAHRQPHDPHADPHGPHDPYADGHDPHADGHEAYVEPREPDLAAVLPGLARIAAAAWWRGMSWATQASLDAGTRVLRAAVDGESPAELFRDGGTELRRAARELLGILEMDEMIEGTAEEVSDGGAPARRDGRAPTLRERGEELLRRSADVHDADEGHPAYARILDELAPDEARILRLLAADGPQPAVDVRAGVLPLGVGSELVAPGLTMIGAEAGCRRLERVPAYLDNLHRLGLIWFSREPVRDAMRYQVLEAQPDVADALRHAGRARTVRRSVHLTRFGEDFCAMCLPLEAIAPAAGAIAGAQSANGIRPGIAGATPGSAGAAPGAGGTAPGAR